MTTAEIRKMDPKEKIILMEELWDSLCYDEESVESPLWHAEVLAERVKEVEEGTARYLTIDELKSGL